MAETRPWQNTSSVLGALTVAPGTKQGAVAFQGVSPTDRSGPPRPLVLLTNGATQISSLMCSRRAPATSLPPGLPYTGGAAPAAAATAPNADTLETV